MTLNFASCITLSRIVLTPFIMYSFVQGGWTFGFILFCAAVLTDLFDGFVARYFQQETRLGQLLDPVADKILLSGVMLTLLSTLHLKGLLSWCVWLLIAKECILLIGAGVLLWQRHIFITPTILSRFVSLCEIILVVVLLSYKVFNVFIPIALVYGLLLFNVCISIILLLWYTKIIIEN